jgi:hypothetical protein
MSEKNLEADALALARRVVKYFGDEEIPAFLNCDIEVRDMARALIAKYGAPLNDQQRDTK